MSIRYSQDFKDSLVKLQQEGRSLKSLAEEFGRSKDSIAIWVKQATPVMIQVQSKTLKDVKQLEKRLAILEEENEILNRTAILLTKKIVRNVGLPLVNQFLAQGYALVRILSALKIKPSTYYNWRLWLPSRQEKRREAIKPYILDVYLKVYETLTQVQAAIGWYINFYNRNRISNVA
ncbi:transposase [Leuconostoc citreum]|uniref:transposase n=1 Tax=Leuconostoc citreum TaxID=33964 RepID=UPI0032DE632A